MLRREVGKVIDNLRPFFKVKGSIHGNGRGFSLFVRLTKRLRPSLIFIFILKKVHVIDLLKPNY